MKDFTGGLNNRSEQLKVSEASDLINMMFDDDTVMTKRHGQSYFDNTNFTNPIVYIDEYRPYTDEPVMIRATSDSFYIEDTKLTSISGKPCGVNHYGKYMFVDGNKLWVYGRFEQTTSTYTKVIGTPINDYVLMEVTSPATGHPQLDATHTKGVLNINYTTYKVYYEPCKNEFEDTYKGANVVPTKLKYLISHNGRIFASGCNEDDDNVFISDIRNAFYFPVSLPIQLPPNSDKVVGLSVYDDAVIIGRFNDVYCITGNTNRPNFGTEVFTLKKINAHTGFASGDSVDVVNNYLFYVGNDGNAYALSSVKNDVRVLSTTILSQQIDIKKSPINISLSDLRTSASVYFQDHWYVVVGDKVLIYSYRHKSWTMFNDFNASFPYKFNDILIWGRKDGRTAKFSEDYLDFGAPFEAFWRSKYFDMDDANSYKQFKEFFLVSHTFESFVSDVDVTFEVDYVDINSKATISNQIAVFGRAKWGDRFINRNIVASIPFIIGRRGRSIRFKFSNGYLPSATLANLEELEVYQKKEGTLVYVTSESCYYLFEDMVWKKKEIYELNQAMKIYQVNGDYELRGKR